MSSSTANGPSSADSGEHALEQPWQLYLHYPTFTQSIENYASEAYQALCEFATVEGFWRYFACLPKPSDVFTEVAPSSSSGPPQLIKRKLDGKSLEAFGLFKKGIKPEWEDPVNVQGGHWECRRDFELPVLDRIWTNTVLALIGETLEAGGAITGARVVDKSKNRRPEYRLEIWTRSRDSAVNEAIRTKLVELLKDGAAPGEATPEFSWKEHRQILTTAAEGYGGNATPASTVAGGVVGGGAGKVGGLGAATASIREKVMGALLS